MSDEEDESVSEGFSASEDEWKPNKDARGGESSDDDDSDFDEMQAAGTAPSAGPSGRSSAGASKKRDQKPPSGIKGALVKKRKASGQSLRSKLYNKYRPPPKTFPTSPSQQNSPSASGSKNARTPNESGAQDRNYADSSSECSVDDYLVNPADLDLRSSFFSAQPSSKDKSPAPQFDCNAGIKVHSDSGSEDNNDSSVEDTATHAFDFRGLLENANSLERTRDALANRAVTAASAKNRAATMDVNALLALGENPNQNYAKALDADKDEVKEKRPSRRDAAEAPSPPMDGPPRLSKTKSTRIKRHTKTRPVSTVVAAAQDTDDSDFEEVADAELGSDEDGAATPNISGDLEIHVGQQPGRVSKEQKTQQELEMAFKRRLNRDIKERYQLQHKVSLMAQMSRSMVYNRLLGDTELMAGALKLLPSKKAYPTERGTELKYLQSFVTWFKTAVKLLSPHLYPEQTEGTKQGIIKEILSQIRRKEARCKQDLIFIFVILARGMGMHCRLIVNLQPMPLRPAASDLIPIKLKSNEKNKSQSQNQTVDSDDKSDDSTGETMERKAAPVINSSKPQLRPLTEPKKSSPSSHSLRSVKKESNAAMPTKKESEDIKTRCSSRIVKEQRERTLNSSVVENESPPKSGHKAYPKTEECGSEEKPSTSKAARPQFSAVKRGGPVTGITGTDENKKARLAPLNASSPIAGRTRKASDKPKPAALQNNIAGTPQKIGSPVVPKLVFSKSKLQNAKHSDAENANPTEKHEPQHQKQLSVRDTRSRSKSPKVHISPNFLTGKSVAVRADRTTSQTRRKGQEAEATTSAGRQLRPRQQIGKLTIPQLDGTDDLPVAKKRLKLEKLHKPQDSDEVFEPARPVKKAPILSKAVEKLRKDRRVLSTDDESGSKGKQRLDAADMWVEVWSEVEEQWICIDLFKGKLHCVDTIRRNASPGLAYVFAFQDDQSLKDVTARYCANWSSIVRKARVEKAWIDETIAPYLGRRTKRDICEDEQLRRIHTEKPLPKSITEFKDHPLYVLERHLLKFQGLYPADAPTLGFIRGEAVYSRDCVHLLHSRDIWLKSARVVKLGEQPYKTVKARPKWDKLTRSVIKDQPLEIFGYWQTQDYEPPTAENGIVPRNAYGNVELFKACMLPKKTVHLRLPGLMRVCKKLNIDCANAVVGFDFHQGACHPTYDGFIVCEEFREVVCAAWEEDQQEQARKEHEKYETRVFGNWKKLIKGLIIRERLKRKYNF
ncbi:DNA repair protein complementing XP-C cells homolog [Drosophila subobscura]|uniref:DNA repair protein complementing XP-C cells homolog n=1 Tax=Drosophila subobscura TaxID=7241 RepID=UPI00155B1BB2|nr:DNA repair protein complementing XP-C cells homolog [Drosophila subobscura]XP_034650827.1 DNA repair protein complementing XP-C cells homolog [Drosophila subobscura]